MYAKYNKLPELKEWYEKSAASFEPGFTDKFIKIINSIGSFKTEMPLEMPRMHEGAHIDMAKSFMKYSMMNAVLGVGMLVLFGGMALAIHRGMSFGMVLVAAGTFFFAGLVVIVYFRSKKARDAKNARKRAEDLFKPD